MRPLKSHRSAALMIVWLMYGCVDPLAGLTILGLEQGGPCDRGQTILEGKIPIELEATQGSLAEVTVTINGESTITLNRAPFKMEVNTTEAPDGLLLLVAKGLDEQGNTDLTTAEICVDNQAPLLEVLSPQQDDTVYIEDTRLEVLVHTADAVGIERIKAEVVLTGGMTVVDCDPITGPDATCTLHPNELKLTFGPGQAEQAPLIITVTDTVGHETRQTMTLNWTTRLLWQKDLYASFAQGIPYAVEVIPSTGHLVVATTADPSSGAIRVLDAQGNPVCAFPSPVASAPTVSQDGSQIFFTSTDALIALNAATCAETWRQSGSFLFSRPVQQGNTLFIGRNGNSQGANPSTAMLAAYAINTGTLLNAIPISANIGDWAPAWPVRADDGKTIYIGSVDGKLYAIDITTPSKLVQRWTYLTGGAVLTRTLVTKDRLYLAGSDAIIHALNPTTGKKIESFNFQANAFRTDVVTSPDESMLYASCTDHTLYALDRRGQVLAQREVGRTISNASFPFTTQYSAPVIGLQGVVFQACTTSKKNTPCGLNALSPEQLELLWFWGTEPDPGGMTFLATPTISGKVLYLGSYRGMLYALDATRSPTN